MSFPSLLPNDFVCIRNEAVPLEFTQALVNSISLSNDSDSETAGLMEAFVKRPYWIARVVKLREDGKFRLNWFAEKPGEPGIFLKTDHYFYEAASALVPFKDGLVSSDERDFYKVKDVKIIQYLLENRARKGELRGGNGPPKKDVVEVFEAFQEMKEEVSTVKASEDENEIEDVQSVLLERKRKRNTLDERKMSFISHNWTKLSPNVGSKYQVSAQIVEQMVKFSKLDKGREIVKEQTKKHRVIPKDISLQDNTYLSILNGHKLATEWTKDEKAAFEEGLYTYSEHFDKVAAHIAKKVHDGAEHKTTADCVQYFYDVFKSSRAYRPWYTREIARLEKIERDRLDRERQALRECRKLQKKRLLDAGIDHKNYNYKGSSVTKSEKLCNAIVKIRKVVKDANLFDENHFLLDKPVSLREYGVEAQKQKLIQLKDIHALSNQVEDTVSLQKKPRDVKKEARSIQEVIEKDINGVNGPANNQASPSFSVKQKQENLFKNLLEQVNSGNINPQQMAHISLMLQAQQQQAMQQDQLQASYDKARQQREQQVLLAAAKAEAMQQQAQSQKEASNTNATVKKLMMAQQQSGQSKYASSSQHQAAVELQVKQLSYLQDLSNLAKQGLVNQKQAQGSSGLTQQNQDHNNQEILRQLNAAAQQAQAAGQPVNSDVLAQLKQMQLFQILQTRQQQADMQNFLQLQQLGQIPQSMTLEQYSALVSQQEQANQLRQLQLMGQLNEAQRQQAQNQAQVQTPSAVDLLSLQQKAQQLQQQQEQRSGSQMNNSIPTEVSEALLNSFNVEKMKLQVTHQQEAVVLQMRQMQELRSAGGKSADRHMLLKKHDAEKKNLSQVQAERQLLLQQEYQHNINLHSNDLQQRSEAQAALNQITVERIKQFNQQLQQREQNLATERQAKLQQQQQQLLQQQQNSQQSNNRMSALAVQQQLQARNAQNLALSQAQAQQFQAALMAEQLKQNGNGGVSGNNASLALQQLKALQQYRAMQQQQQQQANPQQLAQLMQQAQQQQLQNLIQQNHLQQQLHQNQNHSFISQAAQAESQAALNQRLQAYSQQSQRLFAAAQQQHMLQQQLQSQQQKSKSSGQQNYNHRGGNSQQSSQSQQNGKN